MSGFPIETTVNEDEASFQEYIGMGVCHAPPPKRIKLKDSEGDAKKEVVGQELTAKTVEREVDPKSVDIFKSDESQESLEYESAQEDFEEEAVQKKKKKIVDEDEVVTDSQKSAEEEYESDVSLEIDESFDSDLDKTPVKHAIDTDRMNATKKEVPEKPMLQDTMKLFEKKCASEERNDKRSQRISRETKSMENESVSVFGSLNNNGRSPPSAEMKNNDKEPISPSSTIKSDIFKTPKSSMKSDSEEPSVQIQKSTESLEFLNIGSLRKRFESSEKRKEQRAQKEREQEARLVKESEPLQSPEPAGERDTLEKVETEETLPSTSASTSVAPNSTAGKQTYEMFLKDQFEKCFEKRKLVFRPDLLHPSCDPKKNYVYCEVPGYSCRTHERDYDPENKPLILPQLWRAFSPNGRENIHYAQRKALLDCYVKTYQTGGYHLFSGLLETLWGADERESIEMPALEKYFLTESKRVGEAAVLERFANVVRIGLQAESLLPDKIYRLVYDVESATFSQHQCAAILAWMFFVPGKSFKNIITGKERIHVEKLKFLFTYFDAVTHLQPSGVVSFRRVKFWNTDPSRVFQQNQKIYVKVLNTMKIEESALCTQVDFANQYLGGGVLRRGSVQEEIRFLMCPEMIVGMHLCEKMNTTDAISIVGAQAFSSYSGYGHTLKWEPLNSNDARQNDPAYRDKYGRLQVETVAIDAMDHGHRSERDALQVQLKQQCIMREYNKALAGFSSQGPQFSLVPIVSGWWGCGAFKGNKPLKVLIQACAAANFSRTLHICTFGDERMANLTRNMFKKFDDHDVRVGELMKMLMSLPLPEEYTESYVYDTLATMLRARSESKDLSSQATPSGTTSK